MSRKLLSLFSLICILALTAFVATGCEVDDGADGSSTGTDTAGTDTSGGTGDTNISKTSDYFFVRIAPGAGTPASEETSEDPGADIDTVILNDKVDPRNSAPKGFVNPNAVELLSDMTQYSNYKERTVASAGNSINAFDESDPTTIGAGSNCRTSSDGFVSIGLPGDEGAIFTFDTAIDSGDDIIVLEVGGCTREGGGSIPGSEPYSIEVSVSTEAGANWVSLGERAGDGPVTTVSVPMLPVVELP